MMNPMMNPYQQVPFAGQNFYKSTITLGKEYLKIRGLIILLVSLIMIGVGTYHVVNNPNSSSVNTKSSISSESEFNRKLGWYLIGVGLVLFIASIFTLYMYNKAKEQQFF
jgi:cell division protein FtsW (lipid II flippase)